MAALLETISANKARPAHRDGDGSAQAALRHGEPTHIIPGSKPCEAAGGWDRFFTTKT